MIDHKYKLIFIHISRTGGTSIENAICGNDWWNIDPHTKHLTASEAKSIYKDYWDSYFKFSFVRNPWDRLISCYHLGYYNGVDFLNPPINECQEIYFDRKWQDKKGTLFTSKKIGIKSTLGLKYFLDNFKPPPWEQNQLIEYTDIIDLPIDFIGKYENLVEDFNYVQNKIGMTKTQLPHINKQEKNKYNYYYDEICIKKIESMYFNSIKQFNYKYDYIS